MFAKDQTRRNSCVLVLTFLVNETSDDMQYQFVVYLYNSYNHCIKQSKIYRGPSIMA